ncbi:hypothetical protein K1T71_007096 [Dendrolimus kikuchii]|uniref:Uncharacterized protein n=1 Tax=Dendrolimus kikuchii TaxID=765133 RepID=A0ACC1D0N8_9NEOP|nr:hypothetical protein K1T71_007096 [Dendrolimus kikuchii]
MCGAQYVLVVTLLALPGPSCSNPDNLVRLLDTLKTNKRAVCDDNVALVTCPSGTVITILSSKYLDAASEACSMGTISTALEEKEKKCKRPNNVQYSILQTAIEACQKKPKCEISTNLRPGVVDPCPHAKKHVELTYKCRPDEFRSQTGCEGYIVELICNLHSRISILNAQFGRTDYEPETCPQAKGMLEETCTAPYSFEKVIQMCLGKRHCQIKASAQIFESPCNPNTKPYLKVVYACVPFGVLSEKYEAALDNEEIRDLNGIVTTNVGDNRFDESEKPGERWKEPNSITPVADPNFKPVPEIIDVLHAPEKDEEIMNQPKANFERKKNDLSAYTKLFIYAGITIIILAFILLIYIGIRCYRAQKQKKTSKNGDMFSTEAPNIFNDATSDIDNDVDISHISGTFYDPAHPDMLLYQNGPGNRGTLRAMKPLSTIYPCVGTSMYGNDYVPPPMGFTRFNRSRSKEEAMDPDVLTSPKSLGTYSNSQFYYG